MSESVEKLARVRKYIKAQGLDGLVLATRANFAWLSGGGDNHVVSQADVGVGALVVTAKQAFLVANKIEIDRLATEEPLSAFAPKPFPWMLTGLVAISFMVATPFALRAFRGTSKEIAESSEAVGAGREEAD